MVSSDELNAAQQQINAARDQTHTNIAAAKSWADLAKASADASGDGSAISAAADANRAEVAKDATLVARDEASGFAGSASLDADRAASERGLAEAARDRAEAVPDVQDGLLASIVSDEGSESRAALNATYASKGVIVLDSDYPTLADAIAATPSGGTLQVDKAHTTTGVTLDRPVTIRGRGSITTTGNGPAVTITASNVTVDGLRIAGPQYAEMVSTQTGILVTGGTVAAPITGLRVLNCTVESFGYMGLRLNHCTEFEVSRTTVRNVVYAGVLVMSGNRGRIDSSDVLNVTGTGQVNYYGIALTHDKAQPQSTHPRTRDVQVTNNLVDGVTGWEGIDTHGGENIIISGNRVLNCLVGIACVPGEESGSETLAPRSITVTNNFVDSRRTDGTARAGIQLIGAGTLASPAERATGVIANNIIRNHGTENTSGGAGISLYVTRGVVVSGNSIVNASQCGIDVYHSNENLAIIGNVFVDVWTNATAFTAAIFVRSNNNTVTISGNVLSRGDKTATLVNDRGLFIASVTDCTVDDLGNNFTAAAKPLVDNPSITRRRDFAKKVGWNGGVGITRPTITGSQGGNAALGELLTQLHNYGLITNSTTA